MATATKKKVEETEPATRIHYTDPEFVEQVLSLRDEQEMKWDEIAKELECQQGKAMMAYMVGTIPPKERIKGKTDEEIAEGIVAARDEDLNSWGRIAARAGIAESRVRKIYEETTGTSPRGLRVGKGGRYPDGEKPDAPAKAPAKKAVAKKAAPAKKAPAKAAAAKKAAATKNPLLSMDLEQLQERLNGKTITVDRGDARPERIQVKNVSALDGDTMEITDKAGKSRTILVPDVTKATR